MSENIKNTETKEQAKKPTMKEPECNYSMCFAYSGGKCTCLVDNDFKGKPCPFFKDTANYDE